MNKEGIGLGLYICK